MPMLYVIKDGEDKFKFQAVEHIKNPTGEAIIQASLPKGWKLEATEISDVQYMDYLLGPVEMVHYYA